MFYAKGKAQVDAQRQVLALFTISLVAISTWFILGTNDAIGYFAMVLNVMMFYGPLAAAGDVIRTKSTASLPFAPIMWTLIASCLWCIYGIYIRELPVYVPNALGILFATIQMTLYNWARRHELKKTDGDNNITTTLL